MSVGGVEGVLHGGGDAAAVRDGVAVAAGPVPDGGGLLAVGAGAVPAALRLSNASESASAMSP